MAGMLRVPRSRGALSGVLLVLLGIWGGLIPFVGPYVHYAYTPDRAWTYNSGRFWLEILPAVGLVLGGLIVLLSRLRPAALLGASLAALSGCWFAVGSALAPLWTSNLPAQGKPTGGPVAQAVEQIGFFTGLGVVAVCVASIALGRLSVLTVRDLKSAERAAATPDQAAVSKADRAASATAAAAAASRADRAAVFAAEPAGRTASRGSAPVATLMRVAGRRTGEHREQAPDPNDSVSTSTSTSTKQ